jgi:phosphatidylserine/phosphatidylglycerophosphate/cardiolipin synthase-like enzyme
VHGRKVLYPGWDLQQYAQTAVFTQTAVLTVAVAPDNAYETVVAQIDSARESLQIEALTFENLGIKDALVTAAQRGSP